MNLLDKVIKNFDLSDLSQKPKGQNTKPWVLKDMVNNPDQYFAILFTEDDSLNISIRKRPEEDANEEAE